MRHSSIDIVWKGISKCSVQIYLDNITFQAQHLLTISKNTEHAQGIETMNQLMPYQIM